jgi:cytochrome c oxidase subunit 2
LADHLHIVLNGKPNTAMQAWSALNDLEIAAIVTYERNAWGNDTGDAVQPKDVKQAR